MILQQPVEREQMEKLLATGRTDLLTGFVSQKGRQFKAFLVKTPDGKVGFEFVARAKETPKHAGRQSGRILQPPEAGRETPSRSEASYRLDIEVPRAERVRLDEGAPRLDLVAHQLGEDLVGGDAVARSARCSSAARSGSMVVSQSCAGFISPRPL